MAVDRVGRGVPVAGHHAGHASPTYRTSSTAIGGCAGITMSGVTGQAQGRLPCSAAKSAPEYAAMTPGALRAALTSTEVILACAYGLRRKAMCSMPGSVMLSVQLVWPVISRASSLRRRALPNSPACASRCLGLRGHSLTPASAARRDGADDVLVAGAAAQVALKPSRTSSSVGCGFSLSRSAAAMIMPGVQ